jgi:hypothetical protein
MTFIDWIQETATRFREEGVRRGFTESTYELYLGGLRRLNKWYPTGRNVYDEDWDVLILLDGCRVDLAAEVADEYDCLENSRTLTSVGSSSLDWLEKTFTTSRTSEMQSTAYVTGNPFSYRVLRDDDLQLLDEVWKYAWDDDRGTIPPRPITDRAIRAMREESPDRLIVHYMQPHLPSIPEPLSDGMNRETLGQGAGWESPWKRLRRGELEYGTVWSSYRSNLRYVLEDVELLLENVDADTAVISADHGNAAGEYGVYGHPRVPLSVIRSVPWYRTRGTDEGTYEPEVKGGGRSGDVDEKLKSLGYL